MHRQLQNACTHVRLHCTHSMLLLVVTSAGCATAVCRVCLEQHVTQSKGRDRDPLCAVCGKPFILSADTTRTNVRYVVMFVLARALLI